MRINSLSGELDHLTKIAKDAYLASGGIIDQ
jgi:hypothetical protein